MKQNRKIIYLSVFIFAIAIFAVFITNSLNITYAAESYNFPTSNFTTNKSLNNPTKKNYVKNALGNNLSTEYATDFEVIENVRTKDGVYPLYSLMKNLEIPNKDREFFWVGVENTDNPISIQDSGLRYILSHGYNVTNTTNNIFSTGKYGQVNDNNVKQYVTQIAVWLYIYKNKTTKFNNSIYCQDNRCDFKQSYDNIVSVISNAAQVNGYSYLNYITELVNNAETYQAGQTSSMKEIGKIALHINEDNKLITTDTIAPSASSNASNYINYSITLADPNGYGAYLIDEDNNKINNYNNLSGKFKIVIPMIDDITKMNLTSIRVTVSGKFVNDTIKSYRVDQSLDTSTSYPLQIKVSGNKTQKYTDMLFGYVPTEVKSVDFTLYNFTKISKIDVTNSKELPNAKLEIYQVDENGSRLSEEPVKQWTSGSTAYYTTLAVGKYELCETLAPEGYELNTECVKFEVLYDKVTVTVMENAPTVPVPNTFFNRNNIPYLIGGTLLLLGISGVSFGVLKKNKN